MDDLYNMVREILKKIRIFVPYKLEEDLLQECVICVIENHDIEFTELTKIVISCANHFMYEYRKNKRLSRFDDAISNGQYDSTTNEVEINNTNNKLISSDNIGNKQEDSLSIKEQIHSKGDYTLVEIANLLKITKYHLHKSIKNNKLGLKSILRLNKLVKYDKKQATNSLIDKMIKAKITYRDLRISRSSWYYGVSNGFSYSQICKITQALKQQFNITGIINDIH